MSQALEQFLAEQLFDLGLSIPGDDVEYMARFVEEDGLEPEEKVDGVKGMLEGITELPAGIDEILLRVVAKWDELQDLPDVPEEKPSPPTIEVKLSEKEIARQYAMRYAYVEGDQAELYIEDATRQGAPPKGSIAQESEAKRVAEEKRLAVLEALKLDGKKKKHKKQQEGECRTEPADDCGPARAESQPGQGAYALANGEGGAEKRISDGTR